MSLFIIQYNINSIMHHKFARTAEYIYAFMVPISVLAFYCATLTIGKDKSVVSDNTALSSFDVVGLIIVGIGVFIHNFTEQRVQKASIEEDF